MKRILVPIDLSEITDLVVEQARCFVRSLACRLWLLHVLPPLGPTSLNYVNSRHMRQEIARELRAQRRQLQALTQSLRRDRIDVRLRCLAGGVSQVILAEAARIRADLIIMGSHGHGTVYHALFGGVIPRVMTRAPCPVMLVSRRGLEGAWHLASSPGEACLPPSAGETAPAETGGSGAPTESRTQHVPGTPVSG